MKNAVFVCLCFALLVFAVLPVGSIERVWISFCGASLATLFAGTSAVTAALRSGGRESVFWALLGSQSRWRATSSLAMLVV